MIRKQDYPPDWPAISRAIRESARQKCEWCNAPNGNYILRDPKPTEYREIEINGTKTWVPCLDFQVSWMAMGNKLPPEEIRRMKQAGYTRVILTVAHLDRDRSNNAPSNLAALCQRCHLNHDRHAQHIPGRRYGRYHDREQQGKLKF